MPEPQTDFIFSIIAEEFGVVGAFIVVGLFSIILWRGIKIALNSKNQFAKYLCIGMTFQIIFQAIMNLMVVIGMIPVTGYARNWEKITKVVETLINKGKNTILF